jgi:hypothetical protein
MYFVVAHLHKAQPVFLPDFHVMAKANEIRQLLFGGGEKDEPSAFFVVS